MVAAGVQTVTSRLRLQNGFERNGMEFWFPVPFEYLHEVTGGFSDAGNVLACIHNPLKMVLSGWFDVFTERITPPRMTSGRC